MAKGTGMTDGDGRGDYGLVGKVAIVSGGGGPIARTPDEAVTNGRAAAILLARAGAKVCVVGRSAELAQHTVDLIEAEGGGLPRRDRRNHEPLWSAGLPGQ
jgi:NAD(P)-dependent dehydrogenase (short-subunit alcohol dehydrogenase family)